MNLLLAHGSPTGYLYKSHGCRCPICRAEAHADYARNRDHAAELHRSWYQKNRDEVLAKQKAYRDAHPEAETARHARWRREHRDKMREADIRYRLAHPERLAEKSRRFRSENPEIMAARDRERRARKNNAPGSHTAADVRSQYERQRGKCYWCGAKVPWLRKHVDHVIPLSLGGSNGPENLVVSCPSCNLGKGATHPMDYAGRML